MVWLRACAVWLLLILAESIQGTLRQLYVAPVIGDPTARRLSVFTGCAVFFILTWLLIRWVGATTTGTLLGIGALWGGLTVAFELGLGRALGMDWSAILADYDIRRGGLMGIGMLALFFTPLFAVKLRRAASRPALRT